MESSKYQITDEVYRTLQHICCSLWP